MTIIKEVLIRASIEMIWSYLNDKNKLESIWGSRVEADFKENGRLIFSDRGETWRIIGITPPRCMSVQNESKGAPIIITYELSPRRKRTKLKVTISGWENMSPEKARKEIPKTSLEWENRLKFIKQIIESAQRETAKTAN